VLEVRFTNNDRDGIGHNVDFHAVCGPGGGAPVTYAEGGDTKVATFKTLHPGLFIYHCAAAPVPTHIANGMYGLVLVEPEGGLPPVDREFYVVQSEIYGEEAGEEAAEAAEAPAGAKGGAAAKAGNGGNGGKKKGGLATLEYSYPNGLAEHPTYVVFNGAVGRLTEAPLLAEQGESVRVYFGNAGPNLPSAFRIIGTVFDKVYREGDLLSPPARSVQTTTVPPGGAAVVDLTLPVAGSFTLVDHAAFRFDKGAIGFLKARAKGDKRRDIYDSAEPPTPCPNCKLHN